MPKPWGHTGGTTTCVFAPDGRTIVTASVDLSLRFWSATTGRELLRITQEGVPMRIGFSPNGRYLAVSDPTHGRVLVYDALPTQGGQRYGPADVTERKQPTTQRAK